MRIAILILLSSILLSGCGDDLYPPSSGDYVRTDSGLGQAQAWGIDFEIRNTGGGGAAVGGSGGRNVDPEKTDARKTVTLGQYEIVLEKVPGTPITMTINDQTYGTVEVGDRVTIARKIVRVNGVVREPESSESDGTEDSGSEEAAAPASAASEESEGSE